MSEEPPTPLVDLVLLDAVYVEGYEAAEMGSILFVQRYELVGVFKKRFRRER